MPSGPIVFVSDCGTMRTEVTVERRGVEAVVKLRIFDIGLEEWLTRGAAGLAAARKEAMKAELELDEHEWAYFQLTIANVNVRQHKERVAIACDHNWSQNATERPAPTWSTAQVDPILKEPVPPERTEALRREFARQITPIVSPEEDEDIRGAA